MVDLRESNLGEHPVTQHKAFKQGFFGRSQYDSLKEAIANRHTDIKAFKDNYLYALKAPGTNIYKRVEMNTKYHPIIPVEIHDGSLYKKPPQGVLDAVKAKKSKRKAFKSDLNREKKKVVK